MTIKELSKYHLIRIQIENLKDRINELTVLGSSKIADSVSKSNRISNPTDNLAIKVAELKCFLLKKYESLLDEEMKIEKFISSIDDIKIQAIIQLRFLKGYSWSEVAKKMNFERTTPYYHLKKYLKECESSATNRINKTEN